MNAEQRKEFERSLEADRRKTFALNLDDTDVEFESVNNSGLDRLELFLLKIAFLTVKVIVAVFIFGLVLSEPVWLVPLGIAGLTFWAYKNMSKNFYNKSCK